MPLTNTTIRGVLLNEMLTVLKATEPEKTFTKIVDSLPPDFRTQYHQKLIFNTSWYDVAYANSLAQAVRFTTASSQNFAHDLGAKCIDNLMRTVHRILLGMLSPEKMVSQAERLFHTYYKGGILRVKHLGTGLAHLHCSGYTGISPDLWLAVCGGMEAAMRLCGETNIKLTPLLRKTPTETILEVQWGTTNPK